MSWGERWREVLASRYEDGRADHDMTRRVRQGRATYRSGRVSDVRISQGRVTARVQGGRATPFLAEVEIPQLTDDEWDTLIGLLASRVRYSARLLAGHHPEGLEDEALEAGVRLFPSLGDISVAAGHSGEDPFPVVGAAVWEAVAVRLDSSPFPLLKLRGRGRERVLRDVARRRRAGRGSRQVGVDVADISVLGWGHERGPLQSVPVPRVKVPRLTAPTLQVMGDPEGWAGAISAADAFGPLIAGGSKAAVDLLLGEDDS